MAEQQGYACGRSVEEVGALVVASFSEAACSSLPLFARGFICARHSGQRENNEYRHLRTFGGLPEVRKIHLSNCHGPTLCWAAQVGWS